MKVDIFTKGKDRLRNEDCYGYDKEVFIVADGATDKSGKLYDRRTGGEILSRLIVATCLETGLTGEKLVKKLTEICAAFYKQNNTMALANGFYRFAASFVCAKIIKNKLVVTQVGDTAFRINRTKTYLNPWLVGELVSELRARYIQTTGDIKRSRQFILPLLKEQYTFCNDAKSPAGWGVINGIPVPKKFIKIYHFPLNSINSLEIFSDGYYDMPKGIKIKDWEDMYRNIQKQDPYKYKRYKATKAKDDRTVMVVQF